jgi:hypothetical protein
MPSNDSANNSNHSNTNTTQITGHKHRRNKDIIIEPTATALPSLGTISHTMETSSTNSNTSHQSSSSQDQRSFVKSPNQSIQVIDLSKDSSLQYPTNNMELPLLKEDSKLISASPNVMSPSTSSTNIAISSSVTPLDIPGSGDFKDPNEMLLQFHNNSDSLVSIPTQLSSSISTSSTTNVIINKHEIQIDEVLGILKPVVDSGKSNHSKHGNNSNNNSGSNHGNNRSTYRCGKCGQIKVSALLNHSII